MRGNDSVRPVHRDPHGYVTARPEAHPAAPDHAEGEVFRIGNATVVAENGYRILDGVDLQVRLGEHTAVVGPNGCGKSSLIKLITHQYRPYFQPHADPVVSVFGRRRWNMFELRSLLGLVSAELHHVFVGRYGDVSGYEAVLTGFFASRRLTSHEDEITDAMRRQAQDALGLMEALHLSEKPLDEMSTGEARRILIARSLAPDPRALLLDEPTTGLDMVARHRFVETLRRVAQHGKTIILVTHHVEEIFPEIERIVLLKEGRVFRDGARQAVLTSEVLSSAFGAPIGVQRRPDGYLSATVAA
ncbi:MAG TPA: ATP-binding cassette domain-containing protein [Rhodothermales bacterium]|nr:ATP-binding cassette domain-containing protein [Rhodothermales bacterium]